MAMGMVVGLVVEELVRFEDEEEQAARKMSSNREGAMVLMAVPVWTWGAPTT
jgi:hypothetical protein